MACVAANSAPTSSSRGARTRAEPMPASCCPCLMTSMNLGTRALDVLGGRERGDGRNCWSLAVQSRDDSLENVDLLLKSERGGFAERAQADDPGRAVFDQPLGVPG